MLEPFAYSYMTNAMWVSALVGGVCGFLSAYLMLKGWSLIGDALSHSVVPGVAGAYILGLPFALGAFLSGGLGAALLTGFLAESSRIKRDTAMGVVFSGMFALGIVGSTAFPTEWHLDHILFGNMLGMGTQDLWTSALIAGPVTLILALKWRDLMLHAFDPAQAQVSGLRTGLLHYGLLTILALTIVAALSSVGLILAIGLLIAPGAIAFLLVRSFGAMLVVATLVCLFAMVAGVHASFYLDAAPAPTVIVILTALFLLAFLRRSLLARRA